MAEQDNFLGQVLTFTLLYGSLYSTYIWPGESFKFVFEESLNITSSKTSGSTPFTLPGPHNSIKNCKKKKKKKNLVHFLQIKKISIKNNNNQKKKKKLWTWKMEGGLVYSSLIRCGFATKHFLC